MLLHPSQDARNRCRNAAAVLGVFQTAAAAAAAAAGLLLLSGVYVDSQ
jgi:hypothetical protein